MIYISTSCIKERRISDSIETLAQNGFNNIELSGGTDFYDAIYDDILELKIKYQLNYLLHNYFPPPKEHFVLNLASTENNIRQKSIENFSKAIEFAQLSNIKRLGVHAGFYINPNFKQLGGSFSPTILMNKDESMKLFCESFNLLKAKAKNIELYIENNVISLSNLEVYGENPLMLTCFNEYLELRKQIDFKLILDVSHLKVSCETLNLDFENEFNLLIKESDYIHISDNDGKEDQNHPLKKDSEILRLLTKQDLKGKIFTLEVYDNIEEIANTAKLIQNIIDR